MPGLGAARPACSSSLYALSTVLGLIASRSTTSFTRRELITLRSAGRSRRRVAHLADDLLVGGNARAPIEMELDHRSLDSSRRLDNYLIS